MKSHKRAFILSGMACAVIGSAGLFSCASPLAESQTAETKAAQQQHADLRALLLDDLAVTPDDLVNLSEQPDAHALLRISTMSEAEFASIPDAGRRDELLNSELVLTNRVRQLARDTRDAASLAAESGDRERFDRLVSALEVLADANSGEDSLALHRMVAVAVKRLIPEDAEFDR